MVQFKQNLSLRCYFGWIVKYQGFLFRLAVELITIKLKTRRKIFDGKWGILIYQLRLVVNGRYGERGL